MNFQLFFNIIKVCFYVVFFNEIEWREIYILYNIIYFSLCYENNEKNREKISLKINELGIVPTKLAQWMGYFLKIQFEDFKFLQLFLNSLPRLQTKCMEDENIDIEEIKEKFSDIIEEVNIKPFASASIGQIYFGKSKKGDDIVIKVKHNGIETSMKRWKSIMRKINKIQNLNLDFDDFFSNLEDQLDFRKEVENMKLYYKYYKKNIFVKIPEFFGGDEKTIIMSYVPSENFQEIREQLSTEDKSHFTILSKILYQDNIFIKDIIHMDLHNGNWGIQRNSKSIVLYDFGWVLKDQSDFKRFFILTHLGRGGAMDFFMRKYNLNDKEKNLENFTDSLCEKNKIDTLEGVRIIMKMFPGECKMDNFMFCVLSLCIFINSLSDTFEDLDLYLLKEIEFMEKYKVFIPLCSLMKNIKNPEIKVQLEKWYNQVETSQYNSLEIKK